MRLKMASAKWWPFVSASMCSDNIIWNIAIVRMHFCVIFWWFFFFFFFFGGGGEGVACCSIIQRMNFLFWQKWKIYENTSRLFRAYVIYGDTQDSRDSYCDYHCSVFLFMDGVLATATKIQQCTMVTFSDLATKIKETYTGRMSVITKHPLERYKIHVTFDNDCRSPEPLWKAFIWNETTNTYL